MPLLIVFFCSASVSGQDQPVFPGAVGFGVHTKAGTEGRVIRVTNLASEGPGSLRAALEATGPRVVVFDVGGVIDLDRKGLVVTAPSLTLAGQTAPSPGITIVREGIGVRTHDVLIQHIRVRVGDAGLPKRHGWAPDGLSTGGADAYNVVIDHCSIAWAIDENASVSGPLRLGPKATSRRVTFSHCIIAEALNDSTHPKGTHSCGFLIHDFATEIAIIGNLFAHNNRRNPYFKAHTTGAVVNNVIYNPGIFAIQVGFVPAEWRGSEYEPENCRLSVVGNILFHGQDTRPGLPLISHLHWEKCGGSAYIEDNRAYDQAGAPAGIMDHAVTILQDKPVWPKGLKPVSVDQVVDHIIKHAGARPRERDEIDKRIIREFGQRQGQIIDSQEEVSGYPRYQPSSRVLEVPEANRREWLAKLAADLE